MRTQTESMNLFIGALAVLLFTSFMSLNAKAAIKPITCETNFGEKSFTIEHNTVAFHNDHQGRSVSSVSESVTKKSYQGFKKTLYKDGYKHLISIKNENNLNSDDDFLAVTSPKGHKMTYPINCNLVK